MLILTALDILFVWITLAVVFIGLGSFFLARFGGHYRLLDALWTGLAASTAFLEIWNLQLPITSLPTVLLFCAGGLGVLTNRSTLIRSMRESLPSSKWLFFPAIAIVLLLALRSSGPCDHYDTGLYGAPAVRWIQTYPVVPGLANLHGRFGFNSSIFLVVAALQHGPRSDLGIHLFTGFLMATFSLGLLPACSRVAAGSSTAPVDWFHSILAIPTIFWITRSKIVGTLTDEPATIACLVSAGILVEALSHKNADDKSSAAASRLFVATTLLALAVAFKLSTIVFALLLWCLALRAIWLLDSSRPRIKYSIAALALSMLILLPWCARGIILSGYPLFPATALALPVSWKVPLSAVKWYAVGIQSWARIPDAPFRDTRGLHWVGGWLNQALRNRSAFQVPLLISLGGLLMGLIARFLEKPRPRCPWLSLLIPSTAGVIFWFVAAPDPRFAQFAIWTIAGTLGAWGAACLELEHRRLRRTLSVGSLILSSIWCLISFGWKEPILALRGTEQLPPLAKPSLVVRRTISGLAVYIPAQGELCWDGPLPCTPYFDDSLRLRDSSSLRWGFTSEGRAPVFRKF